VFCTGKRCCFCCKIVTSLRLKKTPRIYAEPIGNKGRQGYHARVREKVFLKKSNGRRPQFSCLDPVWLTPLAQRKKWKGFGFQGYSTTSGAGIFGG
jgi:hypothetical protein